MIHDAAIVLEEPLKPPPVLFVVYNYLYQCLSLYLHRVTFALNIGL